MKKKLIIGLIALTVLGMGLLTAPLLFNAKAQEDFTATDTVTVEKAVVKAYFPNLDLARKAVISFTALDTKYEKGCLVMQLSQEEINTLISLGFKIEWLTSQEAEIYTKPQVLLAPELYAAGIPGYTCYRTVEETFASAQAIVSNYPTLASWTDVGNSWQKSAGLGGYDMLVLKLTNSNIPGPKPKFFITAAIHAREYTTAELATRFAEYLVNNYGTDADATWILDYHEVHLMLQTNPDGRKKAESGLSWRKNTNQNYCGATSNNRGADLNRNFTFLWGCCGGSSGSPCDETYRGPSAASEPETQAVEAYVRSQYEDRRGPGINDPAPNDTTGIYLDVHSSGRLVLYPWGHTSSLAPNATQLKTLARKFAYWNQHTPQQAIGLYPTDGTTDGVGYGELGVASFTFELGTAFFETCTYFTNTIIPKNMPALIYAAKVVRAPYMTPAGPDAYNLALSSGASAPGVPAGTVVTLTAAVSDNRYSTANGTEPSQNISEAQYFIDQPPWISNSPTALSAADGNFNSVTENVTGAINTTGWSIGRHIIFVRGKDALANWGALSAIFLYIRDSSANQPPVANFTYTSSNLTVNFTDASSDPDGTVVAWSWNFGDGTTSSSTNPTKTYASSGTYTVILTVTDNASATGSKSVPLSVPSDNVTELTNGQSVTGLSAAKGAWLYYKINVPTGATNLVMKISGGTGDADLYTKFGAKPTTSSYDCRPYKSGNNETCTVALPSQGYYYIGLRAYAAFANVTLNASYTK
jgi:PKD repeat protein/murein tripeptide amidase MpaA